MKVAIQNLMYHICFTHIQNNEKILNDKEPTLIRHTECKILIELKDREMPGYISIGYSRCHPKDNFNKEIGRQYSLKKALKNGDFPKEARTIVWEEYKNWGKKRF